MPTSTRLLPVVHVHDAPATRDVQDRVAPRVQVHGQEPARARNRKMLNASRSVLKGLDRSGLRSENSSSRVTLTVCIESTSVKSISVVIFAGHKNHKDPRTWRAYQREQADKKRKRAGYPLFFSGAPGLTAPAVLAIPGRSERVTTDCSNPYVLLWGRHRRRRARSRVAIARPTAGESGAGADDWVGSGTIVGVGFGVAVGLGVGAGVSVAVLMTSFAGSLRE
jgi:hypothetical protein